MKHETGNKLSDCQLLTPPFFLRFLVSCSQVPDPESPDVADHLDGSSNKEGIVGRSEMSTVGHSL